MGVLGDTCMHFKGASAVDLTSTEALQALGGFATRCSVCIDIVLYSSGKGFYLAHRLGEPTHAHCTLLARNGHECLPRQFNCNWGEAIGAHYVSGWFSHDRCCWKHPRMVHSPLTLEILTIKSSVFLRMTFGRCFLR